MHLSLSAMPYPAKLVVGGNYEGRLKPGSMPFALYREFLLVMSRFDCPYRRELDDPLIYTYVLPHWVRVRHNSVSYIIIKHYILNFIKHCINQKTKTKKTTIYFLFYHQTQPRKHSNITFSTTQK